MRTGILVLVLVAGMGTAAEARHHRHGHGRHPASYDSGSVVAHPAGCPRSLFCGCGAAVRVFGTPRRDLWLAANWLRFPRAVPAAGMVAARRGHVFVIEQVLENGNVIAWDANSGRGQTRIHQVSLRGYQVVNPHG